LANILDGPGYGMCNSMKEAWVCWYEERDCMSLNDG